LMTVPGYPILGISTVTMGGKIIKLPLLEKNHFLPDFDVLTEQERSQSKLLYINYPNNPTGAVATRDFYKRVIEFARENHLIVISDEAYAAFVFDGERPLSFLGVEGAKDVGIAIHSLSKSFNMTGWRLAFLAGNEAIVKAFAHIKYNNDAGQFAAIQKAGAFCLRNPEITQKTLQKYSRRQEKLVKILNCAGFQVRKPKGSFFLYTKSPVGTKYGDVFRNAEDFSLYLIRKKLISTVPWDDTRPHVRFSVTFVANSIAEEDAVLAEIANRLPRGELIFDSS
ncbi:MAG: aminotransferase class I/II-fold pyridoxal phosphate-dependent enzyme, partial [Microcoleaceae cyanobacterium]